LYTLEKRRQYEWVLKEEVFPSKLNHVNSLQLQSEKLNSK